MFRCSGVSGVFSKNDGRNKCRMNGFFLSFLLDARHDKVTKYLPNLA